MRKFDFVKNFKKSVLVYAVIFVVGIIVSCFGVELDINFKGGTKISYSYTGEIAEADIKTALEDVLDAKYTLTMSTSIAGDTQTFEIALAGKDSLSAEKQEAMYTALTKAFKDNKVVLYNSNSVNPTIAGSFLFKSLAAVTLAAVLVVIYVSIRFKNIGGFSAALTALVALVFDVLVSFFTCVIFGLQIDANYIAVVLTILGYSLNDTIVIYDRVRENSKLEPTADIADIVNESLNQSTVRNIVTTVTTILAVLTIVVISELFGLTTLRTFTIPMAFGLISGAVSSLFISAPLWVVWKKRKSAKAK